MFWLILWSVRPVEKHKILKFELQLQPVFNGHIELLVHINKIYKI